MKFAVDSAATAAMISVQRCCCMNIQCMCTLQTESWSIYGPLSSWQWYNEIVSKLSSGAVVLSMTLVYGWWASSQKVTRCQWGLETGLWQSALCLSSEREQSGSIWCKWWKNEGVTDSITQVLVLQLVLAISVEVWHSSRWPMLLTME